MPNITELDKMDAASTAVHKLIIKEYDYTTDAPEVLNTLSESTGGCVLSVKEGKYIRAQKNVRKITAAMKIEMVK
jgi:hypothetical protein